ncbi:MAG: type II secretion system protein GspG [Planctomycetes bacterium]|nr:type II secretion system protein GspG [Planctomycetota bacterium]
MHATARFQPRPSLATRLAVRGMTLVELIVVIVIIGILASVGTYSYFRYVDSAKQQAARAGIAELRKACELYRSTTGIWPNSLEELLTPAGDYQPTMKRQHLNDPWNHPYLYSNPENSDTFLLYSSGPDGNPDTEDDVREKGDEPQ